MDKKLERILADIQKPARYIGGEPGSIMKQPDEMAVRWAFCFPDTYEIGMSHLGMKLLYGLLNAQPDVWCERVFAPWVDMEAAMRYDKSICTKGMRQFRCWAGKCGSTPSRAG